MANAFFVNNFNVNLHVIFVCVGLFCSLFPVIETAKLPELTIDNVVALSSSEIKLSWTTSSPVKRGKVKYVVRYKEKSQTSKRITVTKSMAVLKGLSENTNYVINVRAVKGTTRGDWSNIVQVKTNPKAKVTTVIDEDSIVANISIDNVDTTSLDISWTLSVDPDNIKGFKGYRVIIKDRGSRSARELHTLAANMTVTGLMSDTKYSVNVYIIKKSGSKIKVGTTRIITMAESMQAPKNLRLKSFTDTTIAVKWRHLKKNSRAHPVTGYVIQYRHKHEESQVTCRLKIDNSTKSQILYGLLPTTRYSIRVAGLYDNVTGPYSDWLRVVTSSFVTNSSDVIKVYHISSTEVLLLWEQGLIVSTIEVYKISTNVDTGFKELFLEETIANVSVSAILCELLSATEYRIVMTSYIRHCPSYTVAELTTSDDLCVDDCSSVSFERSTTLIGQHKYQPLLRIIPLPEGAHIVIWSPYNDNTNSSYIYILRILGEPFMSHKFSYFVPIGRKYHVIDDLDCNKTYSISLTLFDAEVRDQPVYQSQYLLVLPIEALDITTEGEVRDIPDKYPDVWFPTTDDVLIRRDLLENTTFYVSEEYIEGTDWVLMSLNSTRNHDIEILIGNKTATKYNTHVTNAQPVVSIINDVTVEEGQPVDVTCLSRGNSYPIISWYNQTILNTSGHVLVGNDSDRMTLTHPSHVGSTCLINQTAYTGSKAFLTIDPMELWDSGQYACVAETDTGTQRSTFTITVTPQPPGPVTYLSSDVISPFDVSIQWMQPDDTPTSSRSAPLIGYRVVVLDEYDVMMKEKNTTDNNINITRLEPNTYYKFSVSAYNGLVEGPRSETEVVTSGIPILEPPENITVTTYNGTTLQVSWLPPAGVRHGQVRLRTYLFRHRKSGGRKSEETPLHGFTNVSIIDLEPEEHYEVQVLAMSEDAQVSFSDWIQGSTLRENYMDESRPPPPPHNVYLRHEGDNIIVTWLPPFPEENVLVRGYAIDVFNNGTKRESMEVGYKESSVIVYDAEMVILYQISVKAKNNAGYSVDQWTELYIPEKYVSENPVENFRGHALSSTKLQLQWDPPAKGAGLFSHYSHYVLSYNIAGDEGPPFPGRGDLPADISTYIVRSLNPYTDYLFTITPYLKRLKGVSANTTVQTFTDRPSNPPENVTLIPLNSTAIMIRCLPPSTGKNGPITTYKTSYRTRSTLRRDVIIAADDNEHLNGYMTELLPSTVYEFRVRALTVNGSGPWSGWYQTRTLAPVPVLPKAPRDLVTSPAATSVVVSWSPPEQDVSQITGYVVGYGRFIPEVYRFTVTNRDHSFTLENLEKDSQYIVSVRSFNDYGESEATFHIIHTTLGIR